MGYFQGLADAAFKKDSQGNDVFYPWGIWGKGRILSAEQKEQMRNVVLGYYKIALFPLIILAVLRFIIPAVVLFVVSTVWFEVRKRQILKGTAFCTEKLTFKEASTNSAKSHSLGMLWFFLVFSILMVAIGVLLVVGGKTAVGVGLALLMGACGCMFAYMIKAHKR